MLGQRLSIWTVVTSYFRTQKSSTWRELQAVRLVLQSLSIPLKGESVKWFTDNQNVPLIILNGSRKHDLLGFGSIYNLRAALYKTGCQLDS